MRCFTDVLLLMLDPLDSRFRAKLYNCLKNFSSKYRWIHNKLHVLILCLKSCSINILSEFYLIHVPLFIIIIIIPLPLVPLFPFPIHSIPLPPSYFHPLFPLYFPSLYPAPWVFDQHSDRVITECQRTAARSCLSSKIWFIKTLFHSG